MALTVMKGTIANVAQLEPGNPASEIPLSLQLCSLQIERASLLSDVD